MNVFYVPRGVLSSLNTSSQTFLTNLENKKSSKKQKSFKYFYFFPRNSYWLLSTQLCLILKPQKKLSLDQTHSQGHSCLEPECFGKQAGEFNRKWGVAKRRALNLSSITYFLSSSGHIPPPPPRNFSETPLPDT